MWRVRARDDRDQPVKLYRSGILPIPRMGEHHVGRKPWKQVRLNHEGLVLRDALAYSAGRRMLVLVSVPAALMITAMLVIRMDALRLGGFLFPLMPLPLLIWKRYRGFMDENPERIMLALLGEGLCAQCGYSLRGIPGGDDWCTVCPECGAAWRLNPPRLKPL